MKTLPVTVIISTYNSEDWLAKVLEGYSFQTYENFEVIVADDGSGDQTKVLIDQFSKDYPVSLRHIWHEDRGYRRQRILNKAIIAAEKSLYFILLMGIAFRGLILLRFMCDMQKRGYFLSGGYCKLSMPMSEAITASDIGAANCFKPSWLSSIGPLGWKQTLKLSVGHAFGKLLDAITPTGATFNNCNSSAWKDDLLAINGYDEKNALWWTGS